MTTTSWTTTLTKDLDEQVFNMPARLVYDLGGQHWLSFQQKDGSWLNIPVSPLRLRRTLNGQLPVSHIAGNADYLIVTNQDVWPNHHMMHPGHDNLDELGFITDLQLLEHRWEDLPGNLANEIFEEWMRQTSMVPDPLWPQAPGERQTQPMPTGGEQ